MEKQSIEILTSASLFQENKTPFQPLILPVTHHIPTFSSIHMKIGDFRVLSVKFFSLQRVLVTFAVQGQKETSRYNNLHRTFV